MDDDVRTPMFAVHIIGAQRRRASSRHAARCAARVRQEAAASMPDSLHNFISVWTWKRAPENFKNLSRYGGDEDWVAFVPNRNTLLRSK